MRRGRVWVVRHEMRTGRRRYAGARAAPGCWGRNPRSAEQLQSRMQKSLPADQQRHRPRRAYWGAREWDHREHSEQEHRNKQRGVGRDTTGGRVSREPSGEEHKRECQCAHPPQHRVTRHNPSTPERKQI